MRDLPATGRETIRTLRSVRSVRDFSPDPIPAEDLAEILEVARWTGSGMNRQPWTFVVVHERATLQAIAAASPNTRHVAGAAAGVIIVMDGGMPSYLAAAAIAFVWVPISLVVFAVIPLVFVVPNLLRGDEAEA